MKSLRDQLLKAGLTDKQSAKNVTKQKQKQNKQAKKDRNTLSESTQQTEQAMREKAARDKQLNQQRQLQAEQKAQLAQIKQLITNSKIDRKDGEISYHFTHNKKIKNLYVTAEQQKQIACGQIVIVTMQTDQYELVPNVVAEKIAQRDESYIIKIEIEKVTLTENDPYADYQIPDDLMW